MTCVVGIIDASGCIYMGSDTQSTQGYTKRHLTNDGKVFIKNGVIFGFTGKLRGAQLIEHELDFPDHTQVNLDKKTFIIKEIIPKLRECFKAAGYSEEVNKQEGHDDEYLLGIDGRLFVIQSNYQVVEDKESYRTIGSGSNVALGSLYTTKTMELTTEERLRLAIAAAINNDLYCGGEIIIKKL